MPTDLTGTPTSLGIGTYNVDADAPSGLGFNAAMGQIDTLIGKRTLDPTTKTTNGAMVWTGASWVSQQIADAQVASNAAIQLSKLNIPNDSTKWARGDGTWAAVSQATELVYVEFTASVSLAATTEASATTVVTASAYTFDGATPVMIEFFAPAANTPVNSGLWCVLYDGATSLGEMAFVGDPSTAYGNSSPLIGKRRLTPSAASHTYSVRSYTSLSGGQILAGAGGAGNYVPGYIRITKAA
ncbi:MAG: hypothetical protein KGL39_15105 [Patescibacteria group bacterium]|nr:hypothetical protein [Patescibacteria group bacterium]